MCSCGCMCARTALKGLGRDPWAGGDSPTTFRLPPPITEGQPDSGEGGVYPPQATQSHRPAPAPHQQQLQALVQARSLRLRARFDPVHEAAPRVAPEQGELGGEAVAAQRGVLHRGPGATHVPHRGDGRSEGSGSGSKTGVGSWPWDARTRPTRGCSRLGRRVLRARLP